MDPLEIEVKFHLPDIPSIRNRILDLGATSRGRVFETNIVFDDAAGSLRRSHRLLRLRSDGENRLTFKSPPPEPRKTDFKIRQETEVIVGDFTAMHRILTALGYVRETVYEKWRETFELDGAHLCVDTLPFGSFLEIEADGETIRDLAGRLGFDWKKRILLNYHALFELVKELENLAFSDITFDHFKGLSVDFTACLARAEAETD
ncbi:MAG: class IV adenylate cyclase [Desulfobacterales bacterium]|nr:class IV adenylate cyclase [Desulfobacterales bacterium]